MILLKIPLLQCNYSPMYIHHINKLIKKPVDMNNIFISKNLLYFLFPVKHFLLLGQLTIDSVGRSYNLKSSYKYILNEQRLHRITYVMTIPTTV